MLTALGRLLGSRFLEHPILIVGAGRSGTSVLLQALAHHPRVLALDGEAPFLTSIGGSAYLYEAADNAEFFRSSLKTPLPYFYRELKRLGYETAAGPHYGLRRSLAGLVRGAGSPLRCTHWCAKTFPNEVVAVGWMRLYPDTRLVYIVRNGCDVVQSRGKFHGFSDNAFEENCRAWAESAPKYRFLDTWDNALKTRHEDLVADPAAFFGKVLGFLRLEPHPGPLAFATSTLVHPLDQSTARGTDVKQQLRSRPPAHEGWTPEQRERFKAICGEAMAELGYAIPF